MIARFREADHDLVAAGDCLISLFHGKEGARKVGRDGRIGAMLLARGLLQLDGWMTGGRKS